MSQLSSPEQAQKFVEKWSASDLSERAASHEHFIDLCRLLGQPAPADTGPAGNAGSADGGFRAQDLADELHPR